MFICVNSFTFSIEVVIQCWCSFQSMCVGDFSFVLASLHRLLKRRQSRDGVIPCNECFGVTSRQNPPKGRDSGHYFVKHLSMPLHSVSIWCERTRGDSGNSEGSAVQEPIVISTAWRCLLSLSLCFDVFFLLETKLE